MTEDDARDWLLGRYGDAKFATLERFVAALRLENTRQNLISKASEGQIWARHIVDSAQLEGFAPSAASWLDVGSGPGLPGIVLAIITERPVVMVEPRRRRTEFLAQTCQALSLRSATVHQAMIEHVRDEPFDAITARAYAGLSDIFASTLHLASQSTTWILPKGRTAEQELEAAWPTWQGVFHVKRSLTDDEARIIVASGVKPR